MKFMYIRNQVMIDGAGLTEGSVEADDLAGAVERIKEIFLYSDVETNYFLKPGVNMVIVDNDDRHEHLVITDNEKLFKVLSFFTREHARQFFRESME